MLRNEASASACLLYNGCFIMFGMMAINVDKLTVLSDKFGA